jgi:diaminohydroxyphosphoribosylaminopyrimidine deaminase/5-amino-6-(5-phosphoribosylamino)uracil reductase
MRDSDLKYMKRALVLAEKGGRDAHPNPRVGAVLVRGGKVVGEGAHERYGQPHAEINALRQAGSRAKGATLYVTLEPCSHQGKTPPCADTLIRAGIVRVVAAMEDPFPLVRGSGFKKLRRAGIRVEKGLLQKEAQALNESFIFSVTQGRPKVILKAAMSLDGKIATISGKSQWITGEKSRKRAHELRAQADALLVGSGTALADNPQLTVRLPGHQRRDGWPKRVLLDTRLRVMPSAFLFKGDQQTLVFCSRKAALNKRKTLQKKGILVFPVPAMGKMLSLKAVLKELYQEGVRVLMVEGGGQVHGSFLDQGLADEAVLFISPKIFGGSAPSWAGGRGFSNPHQTPFLRDTRVEKIGEDYLLTGKVER